MGNVTDRELLERAARNAGVDLAAISKKYQADWQEVWNPLDNRINAFDLLVALRMYVEFQEGLVIVGGFSVCAGLDVSAATRRAIVEAAAL